MPDPQPSRVSSGDIERWFDRYGWSFSSIDKRTFRTGFRGSSASFHILIGLTRHWIVFTINPLVDRPECGWGPMAMKTLCTANQEVNLAKLGLDSDGDAFISVELPCEGFRYSHFSDALSAVSHTADRVILPLLQARTIDALG